jgi:hypothetical protein
MLVLILLFVVMMHGEYNVKYTGCVPPATTFNNAILSQIWLRVLYESHKRHRFFFFLNNINFLPSCNEDTVCLLTGCKVYND